jgi:signal recognition particle GTPase
VQEDEVIAFQKRLEADAFDFNDFLDQFKRMNNMGGLQMLKMMPGFSGVSEKQLYEVEKKLKRYEGMITSMTPEVRRGGSGVGNVLGGEGAEVLVGMVRLLARERRWRAGN